MATIKYISKIKSVQFLVEVIPQSKYANKKTNNIIPVYFFERLFYLKPKDGKTLMSDNVSINDIKSVFLVKDGRLKPVSASDFVDNYVKGFDLPSIYMQLE